MTPSRMTKEIQNRPVRPRWYHHLRVALYKFVFGTPRLCASHIADQGVGRSALLDGANCVKCLGGDPRLSSLSDAELDEIDEMCRKLRSDNEWRQMNENSGQPK